MKKIIPLLLFSLLGSHFAWAQPNHERMEAMRVAFLTRELDLDTEEAQKFWPVYNEMNAALADIREERRELLEEFKDEEKIEEASEEDLKENMNRMLEIEREEIDIRTTYHSKFLEVLSAHKVAQLYRAEEKFKRMLLERMRREERPERGRR